jgi:hypothetical protein
LLLSVPDINLNEVLKIMRAKSKEIIPVAIDTICVDIIKPLADSLTEQDFFYDEDFNDATEKVHGCGIGLNPRARYLKLN